VSGLPLNLWAGIVVAQLTCPLCRTTSDYGVQVCVGCQATIVYGATENDTKSLGPILGVALFACIIYALGWPRLLPGIGIFVGCIVAAAIAINALLRNKVSFHRVMLR